VEHTYSFVDMLH